MSFAFAIGWMLLCAIASAVSLMASFRFCIAWYMLSSVKDGKDSMAGFIAGGVSLFFAVVAVCIIFLTVGVAR